MSATQSGASFVLRLRCLSYGYVRESASAMLPAHVNGSIISRIRRTGKGEGPSIRWREQIRKEKKLIVRKGNGPGDRPSNKMGVKMKRFY